MIDEITDKLKIIEEKRKTKIKVQNIIRSIDATYQKLFIGNKNLEEKQHFLRRFADLINTKDNY